MQRRGRLGAAVAAASLSLALQLVPGPFGPHAAHAHSFVEMSIDTLAQLAHRVVVATPADEMSTWEETDGGRRIVTYHRLQVQSDVVGEGDDEVWVRRLGGVVDKVGQRVHGTAPLRRGQTFLLFLAKRPDGTFSVVGMEQGCFPVTVSKTQEVKVERRRWSHGAVPARPAVRPASMLEGMTLEEARRAIVEAKKRHAK